MSKLTLGLKQGLLTQIASHARTPLYRNAYMLIFSDLASSALGVLYWAIAARLYSEQVVGVNSAAISAMTFLAGLAFINLKGAVLRFVPRAGPNTGRLILSTYLTSMALALIFGVAFVAGGSLLGLNLSFLGGNVPFTLWFIASAIIWCIFSFQDNVLTALRQTIWIPIENIAFGLAKIAMLIVLASALPQQGVFASWTIPAALAILPVSVLLFARLIPRHIAASQEPAVAISWRDIARFAAGDYAGVLFALMATTLLPIMVLSIAGASANAYYYLAWIIAYPLQLMSSNMASSLTVEGSRDPDRLPSLGRRALLNMVRILVPGVAVMVIGAPLILQLFGANYAEQGTTLMRLLALSALPYSVNALFLAMSRVRHHLRTIVLVQGLLASMTLGLSYVLLNQIGITGAGIAWLTSQTAVATVVLLTRLRPLLARPDTPSGEPAKANGG